ncbi:two-component system response regulator NarL [Oceanisphaera avium]|uniref:Two-component system response regulator NarL n=1 Tax=Oceanisphaera avium TaxID=1903694 RepID=A0A1Y0CVZ5_9GAMM|nr:two-component system response regulator NarL [Oceanisphaera avium]ART79378.1 two-component system response regulator NarL [Oceanisphaera avium]
MLVDDHPMLRRGLSDLLSMEADLLPVAQAGSGEEAVALANALNLDLILLDLNMPGMDGIETLHALRNSDIEARIIIFSVSDDKQHVLEALQAGADGYLLKDIEPEELIEQIRLAAHDQLALSPELTHVLAEAIRGRNKSTKVSPMLLTKREKEVLKLIAKGHSNKMIARHLTIAEGTVKVHVKRLLNKLGMRSRTEAAVWVVENELH